MEKRSYILNEIHWWKHCGKKRELVAKLGNQYIFFYITGNKRLKLRFVLKHFNMKRVKTLWNLGLVESAEWKRLEENDYVIGRE